MQGGQARGAGPHLGGGCAVEVFAQHPSHVLACVRCHLVLQQEGELAALADAVEVAIDLVVLAACGQTQRPIESGSHPGLGPASPNAPPQEAWSPSTLGPPGYPSRASSPTLPMQACDVTCHLSWHPEPRTPTSVVPSIP